MTEGYIKELISDIRNEDGSIDESDLIELVEFAHNEGYEEGGARMHECLTAGEEF